MATVLGCCRARADEMAIHGEFLLLFDDHANEPLGRKSSIQLPNISWQMAEQVSSSHVENRARTNTAKLLFPHRHQRHERDFLVPVLS